MRRGAKNELGSCGETLAAEFLLRKGYRELARNLTFRGGEIDLLMQDGEVIALIEVKTQSNYQSIDPIYKITPAKQVKLRFLARIIAAKYPDHSIRVDVITLIGQPPTITHLENILF